MAELKISDLIDIAVLQEIQDGFSALTGMAVVGVDRNSEPITAESRFNGFCKRTRDTIVGCSICDKCGRTVCGQAMDTGAAAMQTCHAGLTDFAVPIMAGGQYLGAFIGGQVLTGEADEEKFRQIADEIDTDPDEYIEALGSVMKADEQTIETAANYLCTVTKAVMDQAYANYSAKEANSELSAVGSDIMKKVGEAESAVERSAEKIEALAEAFEDISSIAEGSAAEVASTTGTVKVIQNIALNTKILGFNASIEASRAKESGKGFGVIAQEVRNLAETSKSSADIIEQAMQKIGAHSKEMTAKVTKTRSTFEQCRAELKEFSDMLKEIVSPSGE